MKDLSDTENILSSEDKKIISDSLTLVSNNYPCKTVLDSKGEKICDEIFNFEIIKNYDEVSLIDAFEFSSDNYKSQLLVLNIVYTKDSELVAQNEFVGVARLKKEYGSVFIRPETFSDKINELLKPMEVDFDFDKEFSKKYFCIASDANKFRSEVNPRLITTIGKFRDLNIEIQGKTLVVRLHKPISLETAKTLMDFLVNINDGKN